MNNIFLKDTSEISLLKNEKNQSIVILNHTIGKYLLENSSFLERSIAEVQKGKDEFTKMLIDVRNIIFTQADLINWFHKIREDARVETDMILIEYEATFGLSLENIDFERVGFLAGIYAETEKYLNLIVAITPLDIHKPSYTILDRLEELDKFYINTGNIPGYYSTQQDIRIIKHKYEIKILMSPGIITYL